MILAVGEQAFHKVIPPVLTMGLQYEYYHKPLMLLQLILSEVSTGDNCFILCVCPCTTQYIKVSVCYIILVLCIFLIKIYTAIIIHVDTSELPVLLWKCLGYWKVITESVIP